MRMKLTPAQWKILFSCVETKQLACSLLSDRENYRLEGSSAQFDELREAVSEALLRVGFDESYNPTSDGVILEELVDKFFVG